MDRWIYLRNNFSGLLTFCLLTKSIELLYTFNKLYLRKIITIIYFYNSLEAEVVVSKLLHQIKGLKMLTKETKFLRVNVTDPIKSLMSHESLHNVLDTIRSDFIESK